MYYLLTYVFAKNVHKKGDKIKWSKIMEVGKLLRRDPKSIHQRIKKLKTGVSKREYKHYSFHEDCIIIMQL